MDEPFVRKVLVLWHWIVMTRALPFLPFVLKTVRIERRTTIPDELVHSIQ
jgi:hypothetical protein